MIFRWLNHSQLREDDQLIAMLYDLGIASKRQLLILTGWTPRALRWRMEQIRSRGRTPEEKDQWLRSFPVAKREEVIAYSLGKLGMRYAQEMRFEYNRGREAPQSQVAHYIGTHDVLIRLLEKGIQRDQVQWLSSVEATELLLRMWEWNKKEINRRELIRPDARLIFSEKRYWVEYDNNTEGPRQLERKFHDYVKTLIPINENSPILWVTFDEQRKDYLARNWGAFCRQFYQDKPVPTMEFFVEHEDTQYLLSNFVETV